MAVAPCIESLQSSNVDSYLGILGRHLSHTPSLWPNSSYL